MRVWWGGRKALFATSDHLKLVLICPRSLVTWFRHHFDIVAQVGANGANVLNGILRHSIIVDHIILWRLVVIFGQLWSFLLDVGHHLHLLLIIVSDRCCWWWWFWFQLMVAVAHVTKRPLSDFERPTKKLFLLVLAPLAVVVRKIRCFVKTLLLLRWHEWGHLRGLLLGCLIKLLLDGCILLTVYPIICHDGGTLEITVESIGRVAASQAPRKDLLLLLVDRHTVVTEIEFERLQIFSICLRLYVFNSHDSSILVFNLVYGLLIFCGRRIVFTICPCSLREHGLFLVISTATFNLLIWLWSQLVIICGNLLLILQKSALISTLLWISCDLRCKLNSVILQFPS